MTLADKLKEARKNAGLTQTELAEKLCVSRQAITKWETGKGIPDVENLRLISKVLNVSIDFLLDDEEVLDKTVIKEQINLDDYVKEGKLRSKKDAVVYSKYPNADIIPLLAKKKSTKGQKIFGELLGWVTDAPFGTDEMYNQLADIHKAYYLVEQKGVQILVTVTEDFIESKVMAKEIVGNKFEIGEYKYRKAAYKVEK
ncbi:MAG: helix-turn-helix domain-containing protein [Lachnospiraceae bacterium]|nr:helix-turn-helix domain-containing protein [Lachnospiraceae bacterium]MEE0686917.1 helix-turn-helix domain-containing protein [Lachnospiraceae bacterium]